MKRTWNNVPGELLTEVNLVLPFLSSGYSDPGVLSGPPENCYPPEGDDERLPDGNAYLDFGVDGKLELTAEQTEKLAGLLESELYEADLEMEE
ncbi:MAG TPA: hypothetical protein VMX74_05815 [Pirellulales bacterium]|nr:hypothetical protein [Pirellulales bacterium]